jgi:hypothetical protein
MLSDNIVDETDVQVPPGLDHNDMWQPSYLNINLTLLSQPKNDLQVGLHLVLPAVHQTIPTHVYDKGHRIAQ